MGVSRGRDGVRVLVACEFSGAVRDAFTANGHDAMSCDLLPSETAGNHYQGDVLDVLGDGWDLMVAFPPCTYICRSGIHWNSRRPERAALTEEALVFVKALMDAPIPKIAIENPIGLISSRIRKPDQVIQPYMFGHDAKKSTCLWLKGLKPLVPTSLVHPRIVDGKALWGNQNDWGNNSDKRHKDRWKDRSRTYAGVASAMATQWGEVRL